MDFTQYDIKPEAFINYLRYYGEHFNKKLCEFACEELYGSNFTKEKVEALLKDNNIEIKGAKMYDVVYVANYLKYMFYGTSISNDAHLAKAIKDVFDKEGHLIFNRFYADSAKSGIPIEWEDMI